jgi:hypothetical protein
MYCRYCGQEVTAESEFCTSCGKRVREEERARPIYKHELTRLKSPREQKNPKAAAALGFFMSWIFLGPVGYIYLGQWNWFWLTFIVQIFAYPLTAFFAYPLLPIVYGIHQYQMAKDVNELRARELSAKSPENLGCAPGEPLKEPEA